MNTEKIEKLKKSLSNSKIPADLKPKIEAEIKRLESLDAIATEKAKEEKEEAKEEAREEAKPVAKTRKTRAKRTSTAKPSETKKPKRTPMSLAKEIRKEGESWKDAQARASKMMKEGSKEITKTVETELDKLTKLVKSKKELRSQVGRTNLLIDAKRKAKPMGRRVSKDGNVYYENRANRTDRGTYGKYHLAEGGYLTDPTFGNFQNQVFAGGGGVKGDRYDGKTEKIVTELKKLKGGLDNKAPFVYQRNGLIYISAEEGDNYADYDNYLYIDEKLEDFADKYDTYWDWENAGAIVLMPLSDEDKYNKGGAVRNERLHVNKAEDYEVRYAKPRPSRKGYKDKRDFELGGTVVTDLAGHTSGGDMGLNAGMPLSGVSGTQYTGLVGETGAMSSGEMFMAGGSVSNLKLGDKVQVVKGINKGLKGIVTNTDKDFFGNYTIDVRGHKLYGFEKDDLIKISNKKYESGGTLPSGAEQSYMITESFGNPAQHYAGGGAIKNQYKGRTAEDVWNNWTTIQRQHFLHDHLSENQFHYLKTKNIDASKLPYDKLNGGLIKILAEHIEMGQYAKGGGIGHYKVKDNVFIDYMDAVNYCDRNNLSYDEIVKTKEYATGGYLTDPTFGNFQNQVFEGGGKVDGFDLVYQKWSKMMGGNGISGTIRTIPENYYVATINDNGEILFEDLESNTKGINKNKVTKLWNQNKIKDTTPKKYYDIRDSYEYARGGGVRTVGNREYSYGRNWTNDHRHVNKGEDHEVKYNRKGKFLGVFNDGGFMSGGEGYAGQSVLLTNTKTPIRQRFIGKELVLQDKQPNGSWSAVVRKTGEKVPFDVYAEDFEQYAKGGALTNERRHVNHEEDYEVRYAKPRPSRKGYKGARKFMAGGINEETPKIYVADLEAYNNGRLVGEWLDLSDYNDADELMDAIQDVLKKSGGEEYAIHDAENIPSSMYSEYMGKRDFEELYEMMDLADRNDLPLSVVTTVVSEYGSGAVDEFYGKYDSADDFAQQLVDDMGIESFIDFERYLIISETDRRLLAQEMADSYVDDIKDEDGGNRLIEEAGMDVSEYEEADSETQEEMLDKAREVVYDEYYDTWYDGLNDPYYFLVEEQGMYSPDDFANANFVQIDYEALAEALEYDYAFVYSDGDLYVFNIR